MQKIMRKTAGVIFESDVLEFVDSLARDKQRSRSFIINSVMRWYGKWLADQKAKVEAARQDKAIQP
jgi:predicted transcriptional regulator